MASTLNALICAALALGVWTSIGYAIGARLLPRALALAAAPTIGWAAHGVVMLPVLSLSGMARPTLIAVTALSVIAAILCIASGRRRGGAPDRTADIALPLWAMAGAAILACLMMAAIIPKISADGVALAGPVFDHAKVAMIDDMARLGVPPGNPFFGETGSPARLSYYYLWHFSAAELTVLTGLGGWNADAGMTWFTAFSSLTLMMGLAIWISGRASSTAWTLIVATTGSIRPVIDVIAGSEAPNALIGWPSGFAGWSFQMTWAPQHVASAGCAVVAGLLLVQLGRQHGSLLMIGFALLAAAAFESSTWIGGVTLPLAVAAIGAVMLIGMRGDRRWPFVLRVAASGALALACASLLIYDQFQMSALRADGAPIGIQPFAVLDEEALPDRIRMILDVPVYWTLFLVTEFAGFYPIGAIMIARLRRDGTIAADRREALVLLGVLAFVSLCVGGFLISKVGANNDLGWRGVLPAVLLLIAFTAAGLARYASAMPLTCAAALVLIALGCLGGARTIYGDVDVRPTASAKQFADSPRMWAAVRAHSSGDERVANNPAFASDMTGWPINISWALLAQRRSCFAGSDLAMPFAALTRARRGEVDAQFTRVFAGRPEADDLQQLARRYHCRLVVLVPQDGAWERDVFAASASYRLVDADPQAWRLYRATDAN